MFSNKVSISSSSGQKLVLVQPVSHTLSCTELDPALMIYWHDQKNELWKCKKKKIGADREGRTLYLGKEGGFNSANCPWQIHDTLQCAGSHFVVAMLPMPIAGSTTVSGWNPQVSMLKVWLKEKKEKISQVKTQAYCWHKNHAAESCQSFSVLTCEAGVLLLWISLGMVEWPFISCLISSSMPLLTRSSHMWWFRMNPGVKWLAFESRSTT